MKISILLLLCVLAFSVSLRAQKKLSAEFSGYLSSLQSARIARLEADPWLSDNLLHNRLNLNLYYGEHLSLTTEIRNRLTWGTSPQTIPAYANYFGGENGWLNLSHFWLEGQSVLLHSKIDRLALALTVGNFTATLGRQRINWGRTYVWNNNDIFNSYSFFDFDYIERPGSDAIRLEYYIGMASKIELAAKADIEGNITAAAYTLINVKSYDIQLIAAMLDEREWSLACGWAGNIWDVGFKGELNYLLPKAAHNSMLHNALLLSAGLEYMFGNQLMLRGEYLYNQAVPPLESMLQVSTSVNNIRNLSFSRNSVFVGADYPITPLLNTSLSLMWMPERKGGFAGPSVAYSLKDNFDVSLVGQYFNIQIEHERMAFTQAFLKFMYSF